MNDQLIACLQQIKERDNLNREAHDITGELIMRCDELQAYAQHKQGCPANNGDMCECGLALTLYEYAENRNLALNIRNAIWQVSYGSAQK